MDVLTVQLLEGYVTDRAKLYSPAGTIQAEAAEERVAILQDISQTPCELQLQLGGRVYLQRLLPTLQHGQQVWGVGALPCPGIMLQESAGTLSICPVLKLYHYIRLHTVAADFLLFALH